MFILMRDMQLFAPFFALLPRDAIRYENKDRVSLCLL